MANTKSAKKQILINARNVERNRHYRTTMRTVIKKYFAILEETSDAAEAKSALTAAQKVINETVTKGAIKKQTSARKVSRLYKHYNEKFAQQPAAES